ncbi:hypothetical protein K2173_028018 [Erythroxylum novogranatense]|uniref:Trimethylguanosine synthase n=1 Tax=Erythroxylum novogranatense TaxID=1862640 RepID=A0AAV8U0P2_9ROSI|nr:hypothetical protein K2173_028018 [Erythroxylum novogranatense]
MDEVERVRAAPAVRALGSLFKFTQVYIWDDGSTETLEVPLFSETSVKKSPERDEDISSNIYVSDANFVQTPEDSELKEQMDALGLPFAFQSNKEIRRNINKSKRKGTRSKHLHGYKEANDHTIEFSEVSGLEIRSPNVLNANTSNSLTSVSALAQSESLCYDGAAYGTESQFRSGEDSAKSTEVTFPAFLGQTFDTTSNSMLTNSQECNSLPQFDVVFNDENKKGKCSSNLDSERSSNNLDSVSSSAVSLADTGVNVGEKELCQSSESDHLRDSFSVCHPGKDEHLCNGNSYQLTMISEFVEASQSPDVLGRNAPDSHQSGDFEDWKVYWDPFYMRNYFYNIKTDVSTWHAPPGMEHLVVDVANEESKNVTYEETEMDGGSPISLGLSNCSESIDGPSVDTGLSYQIFGKDSAGVAAYSSTTEFTLPAEAGSLEHSAEDDVTGKTCNDEVAQCKPSDTQDNCGSFIITTKELVLWYSNMNVDSADPAMDTSGALLDPAMKRRKKKVQKARARQKSLNNIEELGCDDISVQLFANIKKYWCQRYHLFSRFDDGIKMDEEGWFSVTPEPIARHHATRCVGDVIIDCFTGVGAMPSNLQRGEHGSPMCKHLTAIDIDPKKIDYAHHNAAIYGVDDQIDFVKGDFFVLAPKLQADTVFLSPPWGGPDYSKVGTYDMKTMLKPRDGHFIFSKAKQIGGRIIMFLPKNVDINQLAELALYNDPPWSVEVEKNFLNGKLKSVTAYFSDRASANSRSA